MMSPLPFTKEYKYILNGRIPVPEPDVLKWAQWFEKSIKQRRVALTEKGHTRVSTVFLGVDHSMFGDPPLLFETMAFNRDKEMMTQRCSTWEQAEVQHILVCKKIWPDEEKAP